MRMMSEQMDKKLFAERLVVEREYKIQHKALNEVFLNQKAIDGIPDAVFEKTLRDMRLSLVDFVVLKPWWLFGLHPHHMPPEQIPIQLARAKTKLVRRMEKIIEKNPESVAADHARGVKSMAERLYEKLSTEEGRAQFESQSARYGAMDKEARMEVLSTYLDNMPGG
jgi:hypothetical protein